MNCRNCTALLLLVLCVSHPGIAEDAPADDVARNRESAARVAALADRYEFFADASRKLKFERFPKSLLTYSNPIRGEVYGSVFVWTRFDRPVVIGAIFDFRSEDKFDSELHVLSPRGIV